jgi:hypothetical protein
MFNSIFSAVGPMRSLAAATTFNEFESMTREVPFPVDPNIFIAIAIGVAAVALLVLLIVVIAHWKIFTKAGQPGWASIIPIYNIIVLLEIVGKPIWWVVLFFIPVVNIVIMVVLMYRLAVCFGKDVGFTIGLMFLPMIFYPILAFGNSQFRPFPDYGAMPPQMPPHVPPTPAVSTVASQAAPMTPAAPPVLPFVQARRPDRPEPPHMPPQNPMA